MHSVCIVALNYNGWEDTIECLSSLRELEYPSFHIIVVDNGSTNGSLEKMKEWAKQNFLQYNEVAAADIEIGDSAVAFESEQKITFIDAGYNGGFATGNNYGIRYALNNKNSEYIWLLNNDTTVKQNSLQKLIDKASQSDNIAVVGSKLMYYDDKTIIQALGGIYNKYLATSKHFGGMEVDVGQYEDVNISDKVDYIVGASMLIRRTALEDIGLLCEDYFLYFEEIDYILRAKQHGWSIAVAQESIVFHKEGRSTGGSDRESVKSEISEFYSLKNRIVFTKKNFPLYLPIVYLSFLGVALNRIRRRQYKRLAVVWRAISAA